MDADLIRATRAQKLARRSANAILQTFYKSWLFRLEEDNERFCEEARGMWRRGDKPPHRSRRPNNFLGAVSAAAALANEYAATTVLVVKVPDTTGPVNEPTVVRPLGCFAVEPLQRVHHIVVADPDALQWFAKLRTGLDGTSVQSPRGEDCAFLAHHL
jgi:hypothetical protein